MFAGKKSAQIREILISESAWEEMTCLFAPSLIFGLWGLAVAIYPQWMQWNNLLWSIASILLLWTAINRCRSVLLMSAEI